MTAGAELRIYSNFKLAHISTNKKKRGKRKLCFPYSCSLLQSQTRTSDKLANAFFDNSDTFMHFISIVFVWSVSCSIGSLLFASTIDDSVAMDSIGINSAEERHVSTHIPFCASRIYVLVYFL